MGSGGGSGSHGPGTPGSVGGEIRSTTPSQSMDGYQVSSCSVCVCVSECELACVYVHLPHTYEGNLITIIN